MPVILVGYSGGFVPTAWSLEVGGLGNRVRGVFLLDAVYGELDKFASWIENNRSGFFVSAYTRYTQRHDHELMQMLREKGIAISRGYGWSAAARQRGIRRDARWRDASRLRHPRLDGQPRQGSAGQDGGNSGADQGGGQRRVVLEIGDTARMPKPLSVIGD